MPNHWTYKAVSPGDDLSQGDIIARTGPILDILKDIHAYFCDPKYLCFIVLTQSCDLVVRDGACKARQIGLGVVRSLDGILSDNLVELCGTGVAGVYRQEARIAAQQFLERVLNQNEQAHGLFYLHPDADVEIAVPAVAMLRVNISLRSREHYQTLKDARRGGLDTEFRNKLGWLTGNLYSRVDTTDWADHKGGKDTSERLIDDLLDGTGAAEQNVWVPDSWLQAARAKKIDIKALPRGQVRATLETAAPPPPQTIALERVRFRVEQVLGDLNDKQLEQLIELVRGDPICPLLAAQVALSVARGALGTGGGQLLAILDQVPADPRVAASLTARVTQAVEKLKERRGARSVTALLDILRDAPLFDGPGVDCVSEIAERTFGEAFEIQKTALVQALEAERIAGPLAAHIHGLIRAVVEGAVVDKLLGRLENDGSFKAAIKTG